MSIRNFFFATAVAITMSVATGLHAAEGTTGALSLPAPVPYLNTVESYFVGNGVAAGGGAGDSTWEFLAGPDYTCPNYLAREEIHVLIDGSEETLSMQM